MQVGEALARTREGEAEAFCVVVREYQELVRGFIARFVFSSDDVFDLAQETFLTAFQKIHTFEAGGDLAAWLRGIARTTALEFLRKLSRRRKHEAGAAELLVLERMRERLEADDGRSRELLGLLRSCVARLKSANRRAYRLFHERYVSGRSVESIARDESMGESGVRMALLRLRASLRKCLEQEPAAGGERA